MASMITALGLLVWLCGCAILYRKVRRARWLAAGVSTTTLALLGCCAAVATLVSGAAWLAPLAAAVAVVVGVHLRAATTRRIEVSHAGMLL